MPAIDGYTVANVKPSSTLASWHARDSPHIVLDALESDHLREGVDYRALEERRNEALTKRLVVKIGNNWGEFKGEKREDETMNTVGPAAFLVLM